MTDIIHPQNQCVEKGCSQSVWSEDSDFCEEHCLCKECDGTGIIEHQIAVDDFEEWACDVCGKYDDDDRAYDSWKDDQDGQVTIEKEMKEEKNK